MGKGSNNVRIAKINARQAVLVALITAISTFLATYLTVRYQRGPPSDKGGGVTRIGALKAPVDMRSSVWQPFLNGNCTIVVGMFDDEDDRKREATGLIGTGDAMALGRILGTLHSLSAESCDILPSTDLGEHYQDNLVLIGGPDANKVTREFVDASPLRRFKLGDIDIFDSADNDKSYKPDRLKTGEVTKDYAVALKARSPFRPDRYVILVAGGYGYGTHAAAQILESEVYLAQIARIFGNEAFEVLLQTTVSGEHLQSFEIIQP